MKDPLTADIADHLTFDDNRLLAELTGERDAHLSLLEDAFEVRIDPRGNRLSVRGPDDGRRRAVETLNALYDRLKRGEAITADEVRDAVRMSDQQDRHAPVAESPGLAIKTPKRLIKPRSANQGGYLRSLRANELTFGVGPAGTGKTYLAVAHAVALRQAGLVERIILSRPAVEAGEQIGFLPGDMKEKVDPYMRPLYDALYDMLHTDYVERRLQSGEIEIAPLAFMRGRTLAHAAVILDEAQNATVAQMKMFLTRLGDGSHMAITGDPTQTDLPPNVPSGLSDALSLLTGVDGVGVTHFTAQDVVRHPLVARIIDAYDKRAQNQPASSANK